MPIQNFDFSILIHYSEIGLKKNNRNYFEKKFIQNISNHLKDIKHGKIHLISARVFIDNINPQDWEIIKSRLNNVMGLSSALLTIKTENNIDNMKSSINYFLKNNEFDSFRVSSKRHYKGFNRTSIETNIEIGAYIQQKTKKNVVLSNPDCNFIIEILKDKNYIGYDRIIGYGGLPSATQEKALSLLSSGIDSPVASFEMLKRGVNLSYIHFHSYPSVSKQSIENTKELVKILSKYQLQANLYCVPLLNIQEKIMEEIQEKYWVIFFRRSMLKIANLLANKINAVALITGDSIGQVASQTLSNIRAISEVSNLPIIRPLSGMNKEEIINKAKKIGTYQTSVQPYEDCCSFFVPIHPETKAKIDEVLAIDSKIDLNIEYEEALSNIEKEKIKF
tara:strand:- start:5567 stop:6742 length:1176 start_codon:yes stop_codon:yes gene_type:complete